MDSHFYSTRLYVHIYASTLALTGGSVVKNSPANAETTGDVSSIPGSERSPGRGKGNPLQYSCLENPTDRGAWKVTVHRVTKSQTQESTHSASTTLSSLLKLCSKF